MRAEKEIKSFMAILIIFGTRGTPIPSAVASPKGSPAPFLHLPPFNPLFIGWSLLTVLTGEDDEEFAKKSLSNYFILSKILKKKQDKKLKKKQEMLKQH